MGTQTPAGAVLARCVGEERTSAAILGCLQRLASDAPNETVVRELIGRAAGRLDEQTRADELHDGAVPRQESNDPESR